MSQEKQVKKTEKVSKDEACESNDSDVIVHTPKDLIDDQLDNKGRLAAVEDPGSCEVNSCDENCVCEQDKSLKLGYVPKESSKELGIRGEAAACRFLEKRKYDILERNWRCFVGEVDIIANDEDGEIVFVEVKTRSSVDKGLPEEAVTPQKRDKYEKLAAIYLAQHPCDEAIVRFDVISILALAPHRALLRHHVNAFGAVS